MARPTSTRRVALAVTDPSSFEGDVVAGVLAYDEHAAHWRFVDHGGRPFAAFEALDLSAVDGLIVNIYDPAWADAIAAAGVVAVNTVNMFERLPLPRVGNDAAAVGRLGAEHLLERGFHRFGFITQGDTWYSRGRLAAFREVVEQQAGHACHVFEGPSDKEQTRVGPLRDWLTGLPKPIALMAANDLLGRHALLAAAELGLRVPEDVAVLGVDNDRWQTALAPTPMSSIAIDGWQIGYRAAELLDQLMAEGFEPGSEPPPLLWVPPVGVVTRRSTDITLTRDELVTDAMRYIREHAADSITVEDVLAQVGVSRKTLETRMKRALGQTPYTAICRTQVQRAKRMLAETRMPIKEVGVRCGFPSATRFGEVFKRVAGMTATQYREQQYR